VCIGTSKQAVEACGLQHIESIYWYKKGSDAALNNSDKDSSNGHVNGGVHDAFKCLCYLPDRKGLQQLVAKKRPWEQQ
jgi:hypothetical protein